MIINELKNHAPFTFLATITAVVAIFYLSNVSFSEEHFHFFHLSHVIVSAMVTAAIFYKYKKRKISAFLIGISGAIIIGSLSDVFFPYLSWLALKNEVHFHLPLIEETLLVLSCAGLGSFLGITLQKTKQPHFIHVFLSVFASLFYLLVFGSGLIYFTATILVVFLAVIIPCCLSDIVFPFLFLREET